MVKDVAVLMNSTTCNQVCQAQFGKEQRVTVVTAVVIFSALRIRYLDNYGIGTVGCARTSVHRQDWQEQLRAITKYYEVLRDITKYYEILRCSDHFRSICICFGNKVVAAVTAVVARLSNGMLAHNWAVTGCIDLDRKSGPFLF